MEILVSPSSKNVADRLATSKPKASGMGRLHSYQKPVTTETYELFPRLAMRSRDFPVAVSTTIRKSSRADQRTLGGKCGNVLDEMVIGRVGRPLVGQDPGHTGIGGGADELGLGLGGRSDAQRDDEGVVAPECGRQGQRVGVVDLGHGDAVGELGLGVWAGQGRDGVLARLEQGVCNVTTGTAAGLVCRVSTRTAIDISCAGDWGEWLTYAYNGHLGDVVVCHGGGDVIDV